MRLRHLATLSAFALISSACILPEGQHASVNLGATLASKFVHRGQTLVDGPVVQPVLDVAAPTVDGGGLHIAVNSNIDLRDDTGQAWFPDGHAGRVTQFEMIGAYRRTVGQVDLEGGVHSYNLPNGTEFPFGERGGTTEIFLNASMEVLEARPYVQWNYDYDEVRGAYYRFGMTEDFDLGGGFALNLDGSLGYASSAQSAWMYGIDESGWADLRGTAEVSYLYDARTVITASINGSMIVDSTIENWLDDDLNIDSDPIWFTIGVAWAL
jgi:hypothetical protein